MNENIVFVLNKLIESQDEHTESTIRVFNDFNEGLKVYNQFKKEALETSNNYSDPREEDEIETDRYRWFQVYDYDGCDCITIELCSFEVEKYEE